MGLGSVLGLLTLALPAWSMPGIEVIQEGPDFSNATYERQVVDLCVKVQGGFVRHQRYLEEGQHWRFNPDWADLTLSYGVDADPESDLPTKIERTRFSYARVGQTNVYTYDARRRIVKTATGFEWQDKRGNVIQYDASGRMLAYHDRNQVFVHLTRDSEGRIATVQDHHRTPMLSYSYNAAGQLESVTDYSGREVRYSYNGDQLQQVTDALGQVWQYAYVSSGAASGRLHQITDPTGYARSIHYTEQSSSVPTQSVGGRWVRVADGDSSRWAYRVDRVLASVSQQRLVILSHVSDVYGSEYYRFRYDDALKTYSVATIDGTNALRETTYNKDGDKLESVLNGRTTDQVEIDGRKHTHTDENGRITVKVYDEWNNLIKTVHPDHSTVTRRWDPHYSNLLEITDEKGITTGHTYDTQGNRLRTTEAVGRPEQRVTDYTYDAYGNTTSIRTLGNSQTPDATVTMTYDAYGNLTTRTDAEGHTTEYLAHDVLGNVRQQKDARDNTWIYQYDAVGNLTQMTTPLGRVTAYGYDAAGNLTTITEPGEAGEPGEPNPVQPSVTTLVNDGRGRLTSITDPVGATTTMAYDSADRPVAITDPLDHTVQLAYTDDGQPQTITDAAGNTVAMQYGDADGQYNNLLTAIQYPTFTQTLRYDERDRLTERTDSAPEAVPATAARSQTMGYDAVGNQTQVTDALGRTTTYQYDAHRRITRWQDAAQQLTQIAYDNRDNTVSVTNARGIAIRRYEYNGNDALIKELLPDDSALQYAYDGNGNLAQKTDAKGQVTAYTYDADNRLTTVRTFSDQASSQDPANATKTTTFSYDVRNNLIGYSDGQSSATYTYDAADRLIEANTQPDTQNRPSLTLSYRYTYDAAGRKQTYTGPDTITYSYTYTPNGELASIQIPGEGTYTVNEYQWLQPVQTTLPGGGKQLKTLDGYQRPIQIQGLDPAQNPIQKRDYGYNAVDNIESRSTLTDTYSYGYDEVDRLLSIQSAQENNAFTYDGVGNRLSEAQAQAPSDPNDPDSPGTPVTWEYDNSDRLKQKGNITYSYDANGSLIEKTHTDPGTGVATRTYYVYNQDNRLSEVRDNANALIASYTYDPFGRRISKTVHSGTSQTPTSVTTYYLYAEEGLVAEATSAGQITTTYGYEPNTLWGTNPLFIKQNGHFGYYHNDHLGTPQVIVAKTGAVLWRATYEAFGEAVITETNAGQYTKTSNTIENNLRFPGQYYDNETGTHYNFHRDYDPQLGRYIQSDPIGLNGGVNTYRYSYQNPLKMLDPLGLYGICNFESLGIPKEFSKLDRRKRDEIISPVEFESKLKGTQVGIGFLPGFRGLTPTVVLMYELWLVKKVSYTLDIYSITWTEQEGVWVCYDECGNQESTHRDTKVSDPREELVDSKFYTDTIWLNYLLDYPLPLTP